MFDEVKYLIKDAAIPGSIKITLSLITKSISWFPYVFVGIGILLNNQFFIYWLGFFILIEGILFMTLIYVLILTIKYDLKLKNPKKHENLVNKIITTACDKGLIKVFIGLALIILYIIIKLLGIPDEIFKTIITKL